MDDIGLPHSGWGTGTVPVEHGPNGDVTLLESRSGFFSAFQLYGVIDTPDKLEQGGMLLTHSTGGHRARAIVPKQYTHIRVEKSLLSALTRWKIGFRASDALPKLGKRAEGDHPDVLRYTGGRTTLRLEAGEGYIHLTHRSLTGGQKTELHDASGPLRGTVELPGPGLIEVDCLVPWSVTVR
ncbi:hypothetical protein AB0Q95_42910 [Streptomyces sp. NPDC059900]|uniref:hypothetical protein n=1 Tax=Streptomyces sp. NPDC059900 TaxID=3155816 RepID=UPI00341CDA67